MGIKQILFIQTIFISLFSHAQLRLHPILGVAVTQNRMIGESEYLSAYQRHRKNYFGLSFEHPITPKTFIAYNWEVSDVALAVDKGDWRIYGSKGIHKYIPYNPGPSAGLVGTTQSILGSKIYYTLKEIKIIHLNKVKANSSTPLIAAYALEHPKYLIHFDFKPFLGLGLSIVHPVNWASNDYPSDSTPSNPNTSCIGCGNDPFLYTNIGDGSSIVKNHFGAAIQTGFRLQFKKEHKERLTLNFIYSQGLVTLLKTPYEEKIFDYFGTGKLEVAKATFASRGTYWSIYATYPITLVNKKGERRRDRK